MRRRPIHVHTLRCFNKQEMPLPYLSGFSSRFRLLSRVHGQVAYVLLTRSPLTREKQALLSSVRLACIRHAASVHPEPGSNSPFDFCSTLFLRFFSFCYPVFLYWVKLTLFCLVFKDRCTEVLDNNTKPLLLLSIFFSLFFVFFIRKPILLTSILL